MDVYLSYNKNKNVEWMEIQQNGWKTVCTAVTSNQQFEVYQTVSWEWSTSRAGRESNIVLCFTHLVMGYTVPSATLQVAPN